MMLAWIVFLCFRIVSHKQMGWEDVTAAINSRFARCEEKYLSYLDAANPSHRHRFRIGLQYISRSCADDEKTESWRELSDSVRWRPKNSGLVCSVPTRTETASTRRRFSIVDGDDDDNTPKVVGKSKKRSECHVD